MQQPAIKSIVIGIVVNAVLVFIKGSAGILGNSFALVADAVESLSDIFTSIIVFLGYQIALKAPDSDHPYGHGKAEPIATIVVSLALFCAAIIIALESYRKIITPHPLPEKFTLFILAGVILVKESLYRYVKYIGKKTDSNVVKADAIHHRSDAISSLAAFAGISIALVGGKGYEIADDIAAMGASLIILYNSYNIFMPAFAEIMDSAPSQEIEEDIRNIAVQIQDVEGLDKCLVRKMGMHYYVDLHVLVKGALNVREGHRIAHEVKNEILNKIPKIHDVLIHIEPYD